jgi:hypothetical protein
MNTARLDRAVGVLASPPEQIDAPLRPLQTALGLGTAGPVVRSEMPNGERRGS